jgi:HlyD family secretion protein
VTTGNKKLYKLVILLVLGVGLAFGTWWGLRDNHPPLTYMTAAVERGAISRLVVATGTVNPVTTVQVGTYVSGPIKEIFVDFNSPVKQGQRVAQIDPRPFLLKVKQAEANLATARAQVEKDKADLDFKRQVRKRSQELFERNLIARQDVEAAERDYDQAQAQLQLDQARLEQNAAALEEAKVNLEYTDITSPVDGVVVSRNVDVGQTVAASFQTPVLFLIAQDLTKMQVDTNVSESDIGVVSEGQQAFFVVDAYPERKFWGAVTQVRSSPQIVQNVVTYNVVVSMDNSDLALKPGMTANISIVSAHRDNALKVPLAALRFRPPRGGGNGVQDGQRSAPGRPREQSVDKGQEENRRQVWVRRDGQGLSAVPVRIGISDDTFAELLDGSLKEGDLVVTGVRMPSTETPTQTTLPGFNMRWRR